VRHEINATGDKFGRNEQFCVSKCIGAGMFALNVDRFTHRCSRETDIVAYSHGYLHSSLRDRMLAPESPRVGPQIESRSRFGVQLRDCSIRNGHCCRQFSSPGPNVCIITFREVVNDSNPRDFAGIRAVRAISCTSGEVGEFAGTERADKAGTVSQVL